MLKVLQFCFPLLIIVSPSYGTDYRDFLRSAHEGQGFADPMLSPRSGDQVSWLAVANAGKALLVITTTSSAA